MAYLGNRTVNLLNLHYGLHTLALGAGGIFYTVFLLKAGLPAAVVLLAMAAIVALRFVIRPIVLAIAKRAGVKPVLIAGTLLIALQFPLLTQVHGIDAMLAVLVMVSSVGDTLYWTTYHAYFAALGDAEHRGRQLGAREALAQVVGVFAPLSGGWALATLGPAVAFGLVAMVQAASALPLLGTPNVPVRRQAPGAYRAALWGCAIFAADGWIAAGFIIAWGMVLFTSLGESFTAFGGAMALAALAGAATGLVLGGRIDAGHGRRAAWLAFAVMAGTLLFRAAAVTPALALTANAAGALVMCVYVPTAMTAVYNLAKRSPCPLRFHVMAEGAWDVGCGAGCLAAAGLTALGLPLRAALLLSVAGAVAVLVVLRRYYRRGGPQAVLAAAPADA